MKIKLEKLEELPNAKHPNNKEVGYIKIGEFVKEPVIGESFWVGRDWRTSPVTEIINKNIFKTLNSIYKWIEIIE